jgi:hypothetical protein
MIDPGELAKELRIGNRIGVILETIDIEVTADHIKAIYDGDTGYKPIRITEEWLIKLGFEKHKPRHFIHPKTSLFEIYNISTLAEGFKIVGGREKGGIFLATTKELQFVHEVQNSFALTGQELTIQ